MRYVTAAVLLTILGGPLAKAQVASDPLMDIPRYNVSVGYNFLRANAPPAGCDCFGLQGGYASAAVTLKYWLSVAAEVRGSHANNIGPLGQNLTLLTYSAGPRLTVRGRRLSTFGQVLFGAAHGSDSYFPSGTTYSASATSFALTAGGGFDYHLNHRFDLRPLEVQYLRTSLPNGTTNSQNHLVIGAGIVLNFRRHQWTPDPGHERKKADKAMRKASTETIASAQPEAAPARQPEPSTPSNEPVSEQAFHSNVKDALFDYDSYALRPDAIAAVKAAAIYLNAHPALQVLVGGYSDERGTAEYNLALSEKRAQAARDGLIANGVAPDRIDTISYGKEVQTCRTEDEACFQQNRRAAFMPRTH